MRDFTKVPPGIWSKKAFLSLGNSDAKLLYLYFLTSPHQNSSGAFRVPPAYVAADLSWTAKRYMAALDRVHAANLIVYDAEYHEVYITDWFSSNPPMNPNHSKGVLKLIEALQSVEIRERVLKDLSDIAVEKTNNQTNKATAENISSFPTDLSSTGYITGMKRAGRKPYT